MWNDVVRQRPGNPRGQNNLGLGYYNLANAAPNAVSANAYYDEAIPHLQAAVRINSGYWQAAVEAAGPAAVALARPVFHPG